jgi:hypothetical protein
MGADTGRAGGELTSGLGPTFSTAPLYPRRLPCALQVRNNGAFLGVEGWIVERFAELATLEPGPEVSVDPLETIRQRVEALANDERPEAVDEVWKLLLAARTEDGLSKLIHELLAQSHVERVRDRHGNTLRFVLIDTLLDLGFPHALEVSPDELAYHREHDAGTGPRGRLLAGLTLASGIASSAWAGLWTLMLTAVGHEARALWWVFIPLLLAIAHGITAVVQAARALDVRPERANAVQPLKRLGWAGFIGVLSVAIALATEPNAGAFALFIASLPMLSATLSGLTAWRMQSKD